MTDEQPRRQPAPWGGRIARAAAVPVAALAAAVFLATAAPGRAADGLLRDLAGRWATTSGPAVTMDWSPDDDGFTLAWNVPGRGGAEVRERFALTERRPGLFFAEREGGWSMFGEDEPDNNPLLDGPLHWARTTPDTVYVYRVEIDGRGIYVVDRYACRLGEGGQRLEVALLRRLYGGRTEESRMLLTKSAP